MAMNGNSGDRTPDDVAAEVDAFLRTTLPADWVAAVDAGDMEALGHARRTVDPDEIWAKVSAAGYVVPTWSIEFGGLGVDNPIGAAISRTIGRYRMPRFNNTVGVDLVGSALLQWGTDEQKHRYLRPIARYEELWCQLFSEPGAGSDLASLATRAVRDGDSWVLRGQKLWTSLGDVSAFGILLARTDPDVPKHQGITAFLLPMDVDGVTIRPLRQITGDAEFCEVFLDDARIDDALRLGPVGAGWRVAVSVLMQERRAVSGSGALSGTVTGRSIGTLINRHAPVRNASLRQRLVQAYIEDRVINLTSQRAAARRRRASPRAPRVPSRSSSSASTASGCRTWRSTSMAPVPKRGKKATAGCRERRGRSCASVPRRSPAARARCSATSLVSGSWACRRSPKSIVRSPGRRCADRDGD